MRDCPRCGALYWMRAWGNIWQCRICGHTKERKSPVREAISRELTGKGGTDE